MVNISSGQYHEHLERMGDEPGNNKGLVTIYPTVGRPVVAQSADVTLLELHSLSAKDVNGKYWFFPVGSYVLSDRGADEDHQQVTSGGR